METLSRCSLLLCLIVALKVAWAAKDYYGVLGVERTANQTQIKKAFRNLALHFHPDKNKDADAEERFREIAEAYEILSDPQKRRQYDLSDDRSNKRAHFNTRARNFDFDFDALFKHFESDLFDESPHLRSHFASHFGSHFESHFGNDADFDFDHFFKDDMFGETGGFGNRERQKQQSCRTVTQRVGNTVTSYTQCS